jgi:putative membrane protein
MDLIIRILITALGFFLGARFLSGVKCLKYTTSILVAVAVAVLSVTIGTFLKILSLGLLGFGIFSLLLDAFLIMIADWLLDDFKVNSFWWALALAAIVTVVEVILNGVFLG